MTGQMAIFTSLFIGWWVHPKLEDGREFPIILGKCVAMQALAFKAIHSLWMRTSAICISHFPPCQVCTDTLPLLAFTSAFPSSVYIITTVI